MIQITSREFRDKQAEYFDRADNGEEVIIKRRGRTSYMLIPVYDSDFVMTPELEKRLEEGRKQYREGKTVSCKTNEELHSFLDSL
ncbi:MAG: type II toxin-antitoxin system Phd/YefM family antitoxin [Tannerellaceae bacterium]|jgi:antitoxin (DNA-binding transcriptional repressor) of toxin-antitoxin stability system|nr:type II toxin-antitoxin system Phd/YefM family antitoxin [Tannerellaceae bacterium]